MPTITIKAAGLKTLHKRLKNWSQNGAIKDLDKASGKLTELYKAQIKGGKDGANKAMKPVQSNTMDMPVRFATDTAVRKNVRGSRRPLVARGNAVNSIKKKRRDNAFFIEPTTQHGKTVFETNRTAKSLKGGGRRPARDPLIVSDIQTKIVERELIKGLGKVIRK